jgi:murein DD-endopeptidase MepM/ murein hydrolase activator NlpD
MARPATLVGAAMTLAAALGLGYALGGGRARGPALGGEPVADGFDFPVGPPDAAGYYDAQPFGVNQHLGSDWNDVHGGDSDLGAPVFAVAAGQVAQAEDLGGGWGNVVRVVHRVRDGRAVREVESLYAHLDAIEVAVGARLGRGQRLGTIGTAGGHYGPHLHFELRTQARLPLGGGYGKPLGHVDPSAFIRAHRP